MKTLLITESNRIYFRHLCDEKAFDELNKPGAIALGAVEDKEAAGILIGRIVNEILYINWLYVDEKHRGNGAASAMLKRLSNAAFKAGTETIAVIYPDTEENSALTELLSKSGFDLGLSETQYIYKSTLNELDTALANFQRSGNGILTVNQIPQYMLRQFENVLKESGVFVEPELPIKTEEYLPESAAYIKDEKICAMMLFRYEGQSLSLSWLYLDSNFRSSFPLLVGAVLPPLKKKYGAETPITFAVVNEASYRLADRLMPALKKTGIMLGVKDRV